MNPSPSARVPRAKMLAAVRRELLGPAGCGYALNVPPGQEVVDSHVPYVDALTGEEVLTIEYPLNRYGLGVLYPKEAPSEQQEPIDGAVTPGGADEPEKSEEETGLTKEAEEKLAEVSSRASRGEADDSEPMELVDTSRRRPSTMAVSFRVSTGQDTRLLIELPDREPDTSFPVNGRYEPFQAIGRGPNDQEPKPFNWWVRRQVWGSVSFDVPTTLVAGQRHRLTPTRPSFSGLDPIALDFVVYARRFRGGASTDLVLTVALVNRSDPTSAGMDGWSLFQAYFEVQLDSVDGKAVFVALPGKTAMDQPAQSLDFLYREAKTYAVGHGCAANWRAAEPPATDGRVVCIVATHFPSFETRSVTPELRDAAGQPIEVPMAELAGLRTVSDPFRSLENVASAYETRLDELTEKVVDIPLQDREVATQHLDRARRMAARIRNGIASLRNDPNIRRSFMLMNRSMLMQRSRASGKTRTFIAAKGSTKVAGFEPTYAGTDLRSLARDESHRWRPFQIGFILASLDSTADISSADRELVDLIWFPTGGGKTEAYLGLSAFSAILRRMRDPEDAGTDTIMRYTLRLLTAQQFQRAAALICAMNQVRTDEGDLGSSPFTIGLWVGGETTPNTWADATTSLTKLIQNRHGPNPFLVTACPWCKAEMGPVKGSTSPLGYVPGSKKSVRLRCPDPACPFHPSLPLKVVDEDLYDAPATIIIGTVDKFARLAWDPRPRRLFGLGMGGGRVAGPPNLIIQDELHLISGPLGTMVGHFEPIIEHLCRIDAEGGARPKIVCSTATVRNFDDQIRWLFGRDRSALFPPPLLDIGDSFFGVTSIEPSGEHTPGRAYLGIYAPALGSHMNVQIRVYAAALQGVLALATGERDPYWTLMGFFNALRDLGSTTTILRDQVQNHLFTMARRAGNAGKENLEHQRRPWNVIELTSRLRSEEVPQALDRLTVQYGGKGPVDVCLASSMIEVGIDVDRLGLMVVTGQPKTNSQYIQVTGRVGRDVRRPGLVVVAYSPTRARDRSVFERFRSDHERMYAMVEPTSVTPFSRPMLHRGFHAAMVAYARQTTPIERLGSPSSYDLQGLRSFLDIMINRVRTVDPQAEREVTRMFERRSREWETYSPNNWDNWRDPADFDVLQVSSSLVAKDASDHRWRTAQAMRNVDIECVVDDTIVQTIHANEPEREGSDGF